MLSNFLPDGGVALAEKRLHLPPTIIQSVQVI